MRHPTRHSKARLLGIIFSTLLSSPTFAQSAGSNVASVGWAHVSPVSSSDPLTVTNIGGAPANIVQTGTSGAAGSSDTVGAAFEHYFTDHFGVALVGGYPTYLNLEGRGSLATFGVMGKARPWAPQVILRYHFLASDSKFRPYAGIGVNYTWFTNAKITNGDFVTRSFGPGGSATVSASSSWNPVFEAGANYQFDKHWAVGFSVTYIPVSTDLTLTGHTATGMTVVSQTKLRIRPIVTFLNLSYAF
ncbi:OmpW family outer membrane protein [Burkholderia vietnamiensis]|uniref:OmpW family outer membrane protein n=1 Tax=Burkholderia vietnamiensis TaxID=60552 RepID=A0AAW7SYU0_BURVI|nr:OmpW family outer membrane protein [Burkholderia vietnamiensis]MBH9645845.1 OmpW family protein [Burkholderia vietnamiensis]MBR8008846.1 OmpW family protein [Burkholderia vietnamiensis]MDN7551296.1 OmpW family outer membrane protein [Burkholderia vietnamiensis]MDN7795110.1 OmpW family outer membrane protein [Burkholderia vietnamiensis]MDN8043622.1 OmpW family outer membrane protein [Burkholderia vietnamiensis]